MTVKELSLEEKREIIGEWLRRLESGKIAQTKGKLESKYHSQCCLGVLSNVAVEKGLLKKALNPKGNYTYLFGFPEYSLHEEGNLLQFGLNGIWSGEVDFTVTDEIAAILGSKFLDKLNINKSQFTNYGKTNLATLNDRGVKFKTIAAIIRVLTRDILTVSEPETEA